MAKKNETKLKQTALKALAEAETQRLKDKFAILNNRELEILSAINMKIETRDASINTLPPCPICNPEK